MSKSIFEELSEERKKLQSEGKLPQWFTTMGWQAFKEKYLHEADTYEEQITRIVNTVGEYLPEKHQSYFKGRWKEMFMTGHAYLATPVLANTGTKRGLSVSCSGSYIPDSIYGFGESRLEASVLSQEGFGTSAYLGDIRERGTPISRGGKANGLLPVFEDMVSMAEKVSQAGTRRGAWAGYVPLSHNDFWEIADFVKNNPEGANVGWNVSDKDIAKLESGDTDMTERFQRAMYLKCLHGKGYFHFPDKIHRAQPQMYHDKGLKNLSAGLCAEITLHQDEDHTYTCILSGMICSTYDDWKDTDAVYCMTVFLDCLVSEFLEQAKGIKGLEKAVRGTEKGRPVGLGLSGLHSYFQQKGMPFGSMEAHAKNTEIFRHLDKESKRASEWMAKEFGEPEWCKGYGVRNTHRLCCAPNVSSSLIFGSESQGITPFYGNVFTENSASGGMFRVNPEFVELLKGHGQYNDEVIKSVLDNNGSCQHLDFLSDKEKAVFLTAFEIDQRDILRLAFTRQKYIDQAQSLNLFFDSDEDEAYIAEVHKEAFLHEGIKTLYYLRSKAGVSASKGTCSACES